MNAFLELLTAVCIMVVYPFAIIYTALAVCNLYSWLVIITMLAPLYLYCRRVVNERWKNYMKLLKGETREQ